jgi:hypothetical protein
LLLGHPGRDEHFDGDAGFDDSAAIFGVTVMVLVFIGGS